MSRLHRIHRRSLGIALLAAPLLMFAGTQARAASSAGCEGGGFTIKNLVGGGQVGAGESTIPASSLGNRFLVSGRYVEFTVVSSSFGLENWLFTGAANPLDITGGQRTVVWAQKTPDHRGLRLTSDVEVEIDGDEIVIERSGTGDLDMKIQAKDCANGGIFQMEVERGDGTRTLFTHVLADGVFYYDNPNFRAREGDVVPYTNSSGVSLMLTVTPRINVGNDVSRKFVGRDSPQVADRVQPPAGTCVNLIPKRDGTKATVIHCGGISQWNVASGGRMGWVTGEDATEVAPPATNCTQQCQGQNRVRGGAVVLGNPFPVPDANRLKPRFP